MKKYKLKKWVKIVLIDILVNLVIIISYYWTVLKPYTSKLYLSNIFILVGLFLLVTSQIMMLYELWEK